MQERRTTIRVSSTSRIQCCQAEDFLPRDGRLANLSEQGAAVQMKSAPKPGERLTLNIPLPGDEDPLIATGLVRWSRPEASSWHAVGVEWLPLEEATRHRLHRFLYTSTQQPVARVRPSTWPRAWRSTKPAVRTLIFGAALFAAAIAGGVVYLWVLSLRGENKLLTSEVSHRDTMIGVLQQHNSRLTGELGAAQSSLATTTAEVERLDQQAQQLGSEMGRLTVGVAQMQSAYSQATAERDLLMQQVLGLEQERSQLANRLSSVYELKVAIKEAIEARRQSEAAQRELEAGQRKEVDHELLVNGNQGYVIRDGRPVGTPRGSGGVVIRVLDPQPAAP